MECNTFVVKNDGWDAALEDAQAQLRQAKSRVQQLEDVIVVFTRKKESGEPWPGQLSCQIQEQQHSV